MCWSWEVSLGFAVVLLIQLAYLFYRNQYIDRYWVFLLHPIAVQEICQFVVWKYGITDETTIHECNDINRICSRIIVAFTLGLPPLITYTVLETSYFKTKQWIEIYWKCLLVIGTILYLILTIFELTDQDFCIFVGPNGHLDWYETIRSDLPNYISNEFYIVVVVLNFMIPMVSAIFLYQPQWIMFIPMAYISLIFLILYIVLGSESYSVWCWSGSFLLLWALLYVPIAQWLLSYYSEKDINETSNIILKFLLDGAHQHYKRYVIYKHEVSTVINEENNDSDDSDIGRAQIVLKPVNV
eukprot:239694_1